MGADGLAKAAIARELSVSKSTVQQGWSARGLQQRRVETLQLSGDPKFEEKLVDGVGPYLNPSEKAIVLCADEEFSVQALDRTLASLPMVKGRGETTIHDYRRHHPVRRAGRADRHDHQPVHAPAPAPGMVAVPQDHRPAGPRTCRSS